MKNFTYFVPTEIVFGKDVENQAAEMVKKYGGSRILFVYGGQSAVKSGLIARITTLLQQNGIAVCPFGGIQPNPTLQSVYDGIAAGTSFKVDFVLAVGGGSAIDAAKAMAHGLANPEVDVWKFWTREQTVKKTTPLGVILTISAAGSETSSSSVITNTETGEKRGINTDFNRPKFALMNPELTYTLPVHQIACGVVDIMMHTIDRYFTDVTGNETTDAFAAALLKTVVKNAPVLMRNPSDYNAASEIMWCGSLSHNGLTGLGRVADFAVHQLGHELSGMFNVPHAESLSAVFNSWAHYVCHHNYARFAKFGREVWGITEQDDEKCTSLAIAHTVGFFSSLSMPTNLPQLNVGEISAEQIEKMAYSCVFRGTRKVGVFYPLDMEDIIVIYNNANRN
jgi:alcohol dehydrogenase YqhD (iron-dependent ADH family)